MSSFRHRNVLFLQISSHVVLPLYIYIDEKHINWMSDKILQDVVADLRPHIHKKLRDEEPYKTATSGPKAKKFGRLAMFEAETYCAAFYLQRSESHSLLVKTRRFTVEPQTSHQIQSERKVTTMEEAASAGIEGQTKTAASRSKKGVKRKRKTVSEDEEELSDGDSDVENDEQIHSSTQPVPLRRSTRSKRAALAVHRDEDEEIDSGAQGELSDSEDAQHPEIGAAGVPNTIATVTKPSIKEEAVDAPLSSILSHAMPIDDGSQDVEMSLAEDLQLQAMSQSTARSPPKGPIHQATFPFDVDEEEEKPKPVLNLRYKGFTLPDISLSIIVQPSKAGLSRGVTRGPSVVPMDTRGNKSRFLGARLPSEAPATSENRPETNDVTPDDATVQAMDELGGFGASHGRVLPRVPLFNEDTPPPEDFLDDDSSDPYLQDLIHFSQVMNMGSTKRFGIDDEGDEDDHDVFAGDADEGR